ncbi:MAG: TrbI/VirB10 family protein [Cyanobacteria bacterium P01_A01_bin.84]
MTQDINPLQASKHSYSSKDTENNFAWEERMAKLVGLDTQDYKISQLNKNSEHNSEHNFKELNIQTKNQTKNHTQNLEKTQEQVKKEESLASNPFAKAALVGASTLVIVVIAGIFLSQIMGFGNSKKTAKNTQIVQKRSLSGNPETVPRLQQLETEVETLKTKLALAKQTDAIKAAQVALRTTKSPSKVTTPKSLSVTKPRATARNIPRIQTPRIQTPRIQTPRIQTPTPTKTVYIPQIITRTIEVPKSNPDISNKPALNPKPVVKTENLLTPTPPTPPVRAEPIVKVTPTPNPLAEWQRLAKLGSYGQVSLTTNNNLTRRVSTTNKKVETDNVADNIANVSPQTPQPQNKVPTQTNNPKIAQSSQQNPKSLPVGTSAKAVLATALFGETTKNKSEDENVFVVRLQEPLKSSDGEIVLDKGTEMLTQVNSISANGMVQLKVTKVIMKQNKQLIEKSLPENALTIRARKGRPLIAKNYPNNSSSIAWMDAGLFVLGGLGKASELFNRTESRVTTSATGSIVTNSNSDPNIGAGILEGGMKSVVPQIARRNQQAVSRMSRRTNLWFMKAGSKVEVYVNQTMQF